MLAPAVSSSSNSMATSSTSLHSQFSADSSNDGHPSGSAGGIIEPDDVSQDYSTDVREDWRPILQQPANLSDVGERTEEE
jgi:hypothetical protein